ncbi:hypothetical protein [Shimia thalassica]|uniref:hypothetical protein n=1 Tax=Shimia thalassica TaxID=1715693 RepID=UPI003CD0D655
MLVNALIPTMLPATVLGLSACTPDCGEGMECVSDVRGPAYLGVETQLLEGDLVNFHVAMEAKPDDEAALEQVTRYAECAAAQYALIRGFGFARHLRTSVDYVDNAWRGDAVYTISSALPRGLKTIDAEVIVSDCKENGIPTV